MRLALILACASLHAATISRIACGGVGDPGQGGYSWTAANQPALVAQAAPYNAMRVSYGSVPITYTIPVPAGPATVTLSFIEPNKTAAGQRVFHVVVQGSTLIGNSNDLFSLAGLLTPYSQTFQVISTGTITVTLAGVVGNAVISGIQVDVPDAVFVAGNKHQCEDGPSTGGYGNGGLFPGPYVMYSCKNTTGGVLRITRFSCQSDVTGQVCDLQVMDSTGALHSVLTAPVSSTPQGVEGTLLPGASYPDGAVLYWFARVVEPTDAGAPLVKQVLMMALVEP